MTRSPVSMNSGTWMIRPVSSVAGLRAPATLSPWMPGSVWEMANSTEAGSSRPITSSPNMRTIVVLCSMT